MVEEFEALGVPFETRGAMADEYLRALKSLWMDNVASFDGTYCRFAIVLCNPKPIQKPHPTIMIGGESRPAFRRVVAIGDGWHGHLLPHKRESLPEAIHTIRQLAEETDRDPSSLRFAATLFEKSLDNLLRSLRF